MISKIGSLIETIENDEKLIAYIKQAYKEKTGEDIVIPDLKLLNEKQIRKEEDSDIHPNLKFNSFKDKVIALNLPDINDRETRLRLDKLRRIKDTKVLIKESDLSHFSGKDITPDLLYRVLDGFKALKSLEEINLSHNGMGDEFIDVICDFLMLKGLTKLNLSFNKLTKISVKKLVATLKGCKRLLYLDISYNDFTSDKYSCILLCGALKECDKIAHFGINDSSGDSSLRFINNHSSSLTSINLEDSKFKKKNWETLSKILSSKKCKIQKLSLKFCTMNYNFTQNLIKALRKNNTLIYLNLYNTALGDLQGTKIILALEKNEILEELDLGSNFLSIQFCQAFGHVLRNNYHLRKVNISKNQMITRENYFFILEGLVHNQSIISLGDLIDTKIGVKCRECTEKLLNLNKNIEWRDLEMIKKQKANLYISNLGYDNIKEINEKINDEYPNKYFKESLDDFTNNNKNKNEKNNLSPYNYNKHGKYIVPYSLEKTNYIKELEQYQEDNGDNKKKKSYNNKNINNKAKSTGKLKKSKNKMPPTLLNIVASIAQEKFDKDEDLKEFNNISPLKHDNEEDMVDKEEESINYGNIDLDKMEYDNNIEEQNVISKYNLIENNFSNEFQEQTPFYY